MPSTIRVQLTTLKITITATPTLIPQIVSADAFFSGEAPMIDISNLDSTLVQSLTGLIDAGTVDFKINWDPSNAAHAAILAQFISGTNTAASNDTTLLATLTDSGAATLQTVGPIKSFKITGGGSNSLVQATVSQKVNSYTLTP